ncbi:MAG: hypothetical protein K2M91_10980 [Lachnospiraceae bacterium]|nr:hypothetical protein [Lachnospiraceae bacterium]
MKYILISDGNEEYWMELDEEMFALRQVTIDSNSMWHASCREDYLSEGAVIVYELAGECKEVARKVFEEIWTLAVRDYYSEWLEMKEKYSIGCEVQGVCQYFYPQGAIIEGNDFAAVYRGREEVIWREQVTAQVAGYDELNMWLVLV